MNLTSLKHLDLSGGKLQTISSNTFAKLESLQTLNLANNRISHLEVGAFDGLKQLHSLKLTNNAIRKLPAALMSLKKLKLLDLANNPLDCNCASMKLRDVMFARGVKITKQSLCSTPISAKNSPITKPDTKTTCEFEEQDREMQGDQAVQDSAEGSGEDADEVESAEGNNNETAEEKESEQSEAEKAPEEAAVASEATTASTTHTAALVAASSSEEVSSSTAASKDDITFDDSEDSLKKSSTESSNVSIDAQPPNTIENENVDESEKNDDLIISETVSKEASSTESVFESSPEASSKKIDDSIQELGSGEDDDGSGIEGSGMMGRVSPIYFNESTSSPDAEAEEDENKSTTASTSTTAAYSIWSYLDPLSYLPSSGSTESTSESPSTSESSPEEDLEEEQFIKVGESTTKEAVKEPIVPPRIISADESSHTVTNFPTSNNRPFETAYSQESNKGMSSYIVLGVLLAVLVTLIVIAAYKGEFCRQKSKRRDVEKGTELKDMQKSLLENSNQPKIHVTNGNTLENVPLMNSSAPPEEPKDNQRSYDITPAVVTNGSSNPFHDSASDLNDPVKPPRKSTNQEIEAPLNGLNPPMDAIDGPTTNYSLNGGSNEGLNGNCHDKPPLSPGAQRVKITMNDNPDSVLKTPILITRISDLVTPP